MRSCWPDRSMHPHTHGRPHGNAWTIVLLGSLCIISPFAIDLYLPAFATIAREFGTTTSAVSLSLSMYFVGFSAGQILYGPLLDRFGRKPPLYVGMAGFVLFSGACAITHSLRALIILRFLQALTACVAQTGALAMVKDFFPARDSAKIFSLLFLMIGVSPLLAPSLGSLLIAAVGWRAIFGVLAAMALVIVVIVGFALPEPHQPDRSVSLRPVPMVRSFLHILRNPQFLTYTLAGGLSLGGLFTFVAASPVIFIDGYGMSHHTDGLVFTLLVMGFIIGSQANVFLLRRTSSAVLFRAALAVQVVAGVLLLLGSKAHLLGLGGSMAFYALFLSSIGLTYPNSAAIAMAPYSKHAGRASALLGFLQNGIAALLSSLVGVLGGGSVNGLLAFAAVTAFLALMLGARLIPTLVEGDDEAVIAVH